MRILIDSIERLGSQGFGEDWSYGFGGSTSLGYTFIRSGVVWRRRFLVGVLWTWDCDWDWFLHGGVGRYGGSS